MVSRRDNKKLSPKLEKAPSHYGYEAELRDLFSTPVEELPEVDSEIPFQFCGKALPCGHACRGVKDETKCIPCLKPECIERGLEISEMVMKVINTEMAPENSVFTDALCTSFKRNFNNLNGAGNELCGICYTSELGEEPCVRLGCGHVFHANCMHQLLGHRWSTLRISFGFMDCPSCKQAIKLDYKVPKLGVRLNRLTNFKKQIEKDAVQAAKDEGYHKEGRVVDPNDFYFGKLKEFALHNCTFYECFDCKKPFFGGMQDCEAALASEDSTSKEELKCKACKEKGMKICKKHGNEFIDRKCMFCCSLAQFICCRGRFYFCQPCHNDAMNGGKHGPKTACEGGENCPLGLEWHPKAHDDPKKGAFALGCSLCRSNNLE